MNIYEEYGKACIQLEIWQGRVMELKKKIAEEMQKPQKGEAQPDGTAERPT